MTSRAALVGELGVAVAEHAQTEAEVGGATERGRQLVADAEAEAARLLAHAQASVRGTQQRYADAYNAATAAGWTPTDLAALGFKGTTPTGRSSGARVRRTAPTGNTASEDTASEVPQIAVPAQHAHVDTPL